MSDVNDETKAALDIGMQWLRGVAGVAGQDGWSPVRVLLAHIDGFDARLAAAREEMRAVDLARLDHEGWDHIDSAAQALRDAETRIKAAALTSTPLADRIAELEAENKDLRESQEDEHSWSRAMTAEEEAFAAGANAWMSELLGSETYARLWGPELEAFGRGVDNMMVRVGKAEAERDELADSLAYAAGMTVEQVKALHEKAAIDIRTERDALRAQVEAARAEAAKWPGQCGKFVLRAMDEAGPHMLLSATGEVIASGNGTDFGYVAPDERVVPGKPPLKCSECGDGGAPTCTRCGPTPG